MKNTKSTKNTKKTNKKVVVVNLTNYKSEDDVKRSYIVAKVKAGLPIDIDDLLFFAIYAVEEFEGYLFRENNAVVREGNKFILGNIIPAQVKCVCECNNCEEPKKKPNIFKRFWNWITRKN